MSTAQQVNTSGSMTPSRLLGGVVTVMVLLLPLIVLLRLGQANEAAKEPNIRMPDLTQSFKLIPKLKKKCIALEKKVKELEETRAVQANLIVELEMQADELEQQLLNRQEVIMDLDAQLQDIEDSQRALWGRNQELEAQIAEIQQHLNIVEGEQASAEITHQNPTDELHYKLCETSSEGESVDAVYYSTHAEQPDMESELSTLPEDPQAAPEALDYFQRQLNGHVERMND
jgi:chromosome segregation ATPase